MIPHSSTRLVVSHANKAKDKSSASRKVIKEERTGRDVATLQCSASFHRAILASLHRYIICARTQTLTAKNLNWTIKRATLFVARRTPPDSIESNERFLHRVWLLMEPDFPSDCIKHLEIIIKRSRLILSGVEVSREKQKPTPSTDCLLPEEKLVFALCFFLASLASCSVRIQSLALTLVLTAKVIAVWTEKTAKDSKNYSLVPQRIQIFARGIAQPRKVQWIKTKKVTFKVNFRGSLRIGLKAVKSKVKNPIRQSEIRIKVR